MSEPVEATISETIEGELLSVGGPARLLDTGRHNYVRCEDVVAIYGVVGEIRKTDSARMLVTSNVAWGDIYSIVVLRSGHTLPAYDEAEALRKRWEAAMGVGE